MRDLRLAARLIVGGGRSELVRLCLMSLGLAVGVVALLLVARVPGVLHSRDQVMSERAPVPAVGEQRPALSVLSNYGSWRGKPFLRVYVADVTPDAAPPPGLRAVPRPGEVALSPAAAALMGDDRFRALVRGRVTQQIGPVGLTGPDELLAYVGTDREELRAGSGAVGWGVPTGVAVDETDQYRYVAVEMAILILPASVIYVYACGQLAAATRRRRYAALRLVGASRQTLTRVATIEAAVACIAGIALGILAFRLVNGPLGRSGLVGLSWFESQSRLGPLDVACLLVAAPLGARIAGGLSGRRAVINPLQQRRSTEERPPRWWLLVPLVSGLALLVPLLPFGRRGHQGGTIQTLLVLGATLSALGLLLASRLLSVLVARAVRSRVRALPVRLGLSRLEAEGAAATRLVSGLALLVLIAGTGAGLTHAAERQASAETRSFRVHVYGDDIPVQARDDVSQVSAAGLSWATVHSKVDADRSAPDTEARWRERVGMLVADCQEARELLRAALPGCRSEQLYRVEAPNSRLVLDPGEPVEFATANKVRRLVVPEQRVQTDSRGFITAGSVSLLFTGQQPPGGWYDGSIFFFVVPPGIESLDRFSTALAQVAPTAPVNASLDMSALIAYRAHRSAIEAGVGVGFALGLLAVLISLIDRSIERRRDVVTMVILGTRTRTIRLAQAVFGSVPMVVGGSLALLVGFVTANALSTLENPSPRWYWTPLSAGLPLVLVGMVVTAASALVVVGVKPRVEDLRRE